MEFYVKTVTYDNYKSFIGKRVEVSITCYEVGMMYPDNNILIGMNENYYYFVSDKDTDNECYWHWEVESEKGFGKLTMSIEVFESPLTFGDYPD